MSKNKVLQSTRNEIYLIQKDRVEKGKSVTYKDGKDYFVSPGYNTVRKSVLVSYYNGFGMKELVKLM